MTQGLTASIVVNAANTQDLERTLASVQFADEVRVAEVKEVEDADHSRGSFRTEAFAQARHPFVLCLGDGEVVSPPLRAELAALMALPPSAEAPAAYRVPRRAIYLGRAVRCRAWQGEGDLRLIDRRKTSAGVAGGRIAIPGGSPGETRVGELRGEILWNGTMSLASLLHDLARETGMAAGSPPALRELATAPIMELWRSFLRAGGLQSGGAGFLLAAMDSLEVLVRVARRWEAANRRSEARPHR
jgi:hypothetical protein